jgi:predicted esterase
MAYPRHRMNSLALLTLGLALGACGSTAVTAPTDAAAPTDLGAVTDAPVAADVPATPDVPALADAPPPARDVVATDTVEPPLMVTGCDALQAGTVNNFMVDGVARSFILTLPTGATGPGGRWPVVFAWHGAGDNAANFNRLLSGQVNNSAMPFILVTPVSRRLVPPAGLEWEQLQARGLNGDARLFDAVLQCVGERYGVDEDRIYTGGFSAGAIMSDLLGVLRGDRLAAIAAFSGGYFANPENPPTLGAARGFVGWPEPSTTNRYPQLIAFGGERDFISLVVAQARFDQYAANDVPWLNAAGHDVIVCDHGAGHTVPSALLGATLVGFFQSHPRGTRRSPWGMTPPSNLPSYCRYSRGAGD